MPIPSLIKIVSMPLMVSMLVQSLYNIVDGIFVSSISKQALTATSLAYPMQMLMLSLAIGLGVGLNALLSKTLGTKDIVQAGRIVVSGYIQAVILSICFCIISLFLSRPFIRLFTSNEKEIQMSVCYLKICLSGSFGIFASTTGERILQVTGNSLLSMISQTTGAIINIILDYLFICVLHFGIPGAAFATVISQWLSAFIGFGMNDKVNGQIIKSIQKIGFYRDIVQQIYQVGIPTMVMQMSGSCMIFILNHTLKDISGAIVTFGIYYKTWTFLFMPISGFAQGLLPVVGYNYGAKRYDRVREALRYTLKTAVSLMAIGSLIFFAFPNILLSPYHLPADYIELGTYIFRTFALTFVFSGISITLGFYFSALGNGWVGMTASLIRQVIVPIPLITVFIGFIDFRFIWIAFIFSEAASACYCLAKYKAAKL